MVLLYFHREFPDTTEIDDFFYKHNNVSDLDISLFSDILNKKANISVYIRKDKTLANKLKEEFENYF